MSRADFIVAANSTTSLNGGALNLSCTDLIVAGTLNVGSGAVLNARNVTVQAGGVIQGGGGFIALSGDWTVSPTGQFVAGMSDVHFDDNCVTGNSLISGNTTFFAVHFTSTTGKSFVFAANSTQTVTQLFEFTGTGSAPSQFRSSVPGQTAFIDLQSSGAQQVSHVGATDVWATGQWLAPFLTNEGGGGNAQRWFGVPDDNGVVKQIPATGDAALVALAALLAGTGVLALRSSRRLQKFAGGRRPGRTLQ